MGNGDFIISIGNIFLLFKSIQTHFGAHLAYISMGTRAYSYGDKVTEE
jgi:hypothetical protein